MALRARRGKETTEDLPPADLGTLRAVAAHSPLDFQERPQLQVLEGQVGLPLSLEP
jgi:hypothetical protein